MICLQPSSQPSSRFTSSSVYWMAALFFRKRFVLTCSQRRRKMNLAAAPLPTCPLAAELKWTEKRTNQLRKWFCSVCSLKKIFRRNHLWKIQQNSSKVSKSEQRKTVNDTRVSWRIFLCGGQVLWSPFQGLITCGRGRRVTWPWLWHHEEQFEEIKSAICAHLFHSSFVICCSSLRMCSDNVIDWTAVLPAPFKLVWLLVFMYYEEDSPWIKATAL